MDLFYKDAANIGTLAVVSLPPIRGPANLLVFHHPSPRGRTLIPGVLISHIDYQQMTSTQFQQSLENVLYVYSFGDQMGNMNIRGMAFPRQCDSESNGIAELLKFYKENRVSKSGSRIRLTFADEVINGFLVGLALTTVDASSGLHSFTMLIKTIPAAFRGE